MMSWREIRSLKKGMKEIWNKKCILKNINKKLDLTTSINNGLLCIQFISCVFGGKQIFSLLLYNLFMLQAMLLICL